MVKPNKKNEAYIVGCKIRQLRKLKGLTQEQLSEKICIDNKRLSRIETGRSMPTLKDAKELSQILDYNFFDLIDTIDQQSIEMPDNILYQSLSILNSASNENEKLYYLETLKSAQKCLKLISGNIK